VALLSLRAAVVLSLHAAIDVHASIAATLNVLRALHIIVFLTAGDPR